MEQQSEAQAQVQAATHPDHPYLCGKALLDKIINKPKKDDIRDMSLTEAIDRINEVTVGSYYTTMYIGMCSFTRKIYDEETTFCKKLRGCSNTHKLPGGWIQCSPEGDHFMECCSMEHNIRNKLFPVNLTDISSETDLRIPRSIKKPRDPPRFSNGNVGENCSIFLSRTQNTMHVKVDFFDEITGERLEKSVKLKTLMEVNKIEIITLKPIYYSHTYILEQTDNVQRLFNYYNARYEEFFNETIVPMFESEKINFRILPQEYNPAKNTSR